LWGRRIQVPIVPRRFVPWTVLQSSLYRQRTQVQVPIMTRHFIPSTICFTPNFVPKVFY
jgi:hypothetical protein